MSHKQYRQTDEYWPTDLENCDPLIKETTERCAREREQESEEWERRRRSENFIEYDRPHSSEPPKCTCVRTPRKKANSHKASPMQEPVTRSSTQSNSGTIVNATSRSTATRPPILKLVPTTNVQIQASSASFPSSSASFPSSGPYWYIKRPHLIDPHLAPWSEFGLNKENTTSQPFTQQHTVEITNASSAKPLVVKPGSSARAPLSIQTPQVIEIGIVPSAAPTTSKKVHFLSNIQTFIYNYEEDADGLITTVSTSDVLFDKPSTKLSRCSNKTRTPHPSSIFVNMEMEQQSSDNQIHEVVKRTVQKVQKTEKQLSASSSGVMDIGRMEMKQQSGNDQIYEVVERPVQRIQKTDKKVSASYSGVSNTGQITQEERAKEEETWKIVERVVQKVPKTEANLPNTLPCHGYRNDECYQVVERVVTVAKKTSH